MHRDNGRTLKQLIPALVLAVLPLAPLSGQAREFARHAAAPELRLPPAPRTPLAPLKAVAAPRETTPKSGWRAAYGPGERADYEVRLGALSLGKGAMEVVGSEIVDGHETYHTVLRVSGGLPLARVNDRYESWVDADQLFSRRFKKDQRELRFKRKRAFDFFPETRTYHRTDNGERGTLQTSEPLDEVSFLVHARSLPLKVGETYTIDRYYKAGRPVTLKVLRKERITVPAGTFETIVVQPTISTSGLFGEGGKAEVYFTDDDRRVLVRMTSQVPVVGSLSLHLRNYRPAQ
jgi:hypothetical protein